MEARRVIHVGEGIEADAVNNMRKELETRGLKVENIKNVCIAMTPAYKTGVYYNFPNANIVFDKFHVKKYLNEAFNKVWHLERRENEMLICHKYTFLIDYSNLTEYKKAQLNMLTLKYPKLGEAYRLKVMLDEFWQI